MDVNIIQCAFVEAAKQQVGIVEFRGTERTVLPYYSKRELAQSSSNIDAVVIHFLSELDWASWKAHRRVMVSVSTETLSDQHQFDLWMVKAKKAQQSCPSKLLVMVQCVDPEKQGNHFWNAVNQISAQFDGVSVSSSQLANSIANEEVGNIWEIVEVDMEDFRGQSGAFISTMAALKMKGATVAVSGVKDYVDRHLAESTGVDFLQGTAFSSPCALIARVQE